VALVRRCGGACSCLFRKMASYNITLHYLRYVHDVIFFFFFNVFSCCVMGFGGYVKKPGMCMNKVGVEI
jgi:hypothetical protein